jgi:hypothetical protein
MVPNSVADPGCLSRILILRYPFRISDPGSGYYPFRIPDPETATKERGSHKFHKIKKNFLNAEKNLGQFSKIFTPKNLSLSSEKYGVGIRDKTFPGSGSATLYPWYGTGT